MTVPLARLGRAAVDLLVETGSVPAATATESALAAALTAARRDPAAPLPRADATEDAAPTVRIGVELVVRASTGVAAASPSAAVR